MRKILLAVIILLALATIPTAQTVTRTLSWEHLGVSLTEVASYAFSVQIDKTTPIAISPTCALSGTIVSCQSPITFTPAPHVITLTATNAFGSTSGSLSGTSPTPAINIKVTVVVTVP